MSLWHEEMDEAEGGHAETRMAWSVGGKGGGSEWLVAKTTASGHKVNVSELSADWYKYCLSSLHEVRVVP